MIFRKRNVRYLLHNDGMNELLEDLEVEYGGCLIVVPKGYVCDGSSIPRVAWRVCGGPRMQENLLAGTLHDFLYSTNMFDRKMCDELFYKALRSLGKSWIVSKIMYWSVRAFGGSHY